MLTACNYGPNQVAAASSEPSSAAQDSSGRSLQIRVSSTHRTYACQGDGVDSVQVTGSSDMLTITGHCGSLQVTGSSNSITIDSVQSIQFTGNSNSVLYRSGKPSISDTGQSNSAAHMNGQITTSRGNTVTSNNGTVTSTDENGSTTVVGGALGAAVSGALQAANGAAATAGAVQGIQRQGNNLNIALSNQQTTQDCGDGAIVNINGYRNDITLTGSCSQVTLNGWGNTVRIEEAAGIQIVGHTNTITWQRGRNVRKPSVQITGGMDNSVRHVTQASE
jgi:hypothetical protein